MFALHETTRKRACRAAFFALCVAPTLATAAWIGYAQRPWRGTDEARRLAAELHGRVVLAGFETPRPGARRAEKFTFTGAADERPIATLESWNCRRRLGVVSITASEARVNVADVPALAAKAVDWLSASQAEVIELRLERLAIDLPPIVPRASRDFVLNGVNVRIDVDAAGAWKLEATVAGDSARRLQIAATRHPDHDDVTMVVNGATLPTPIELLSTVFPGVDALGAGAAFAGELKLEFGDGPIRGSAKGQIDGAELSVLLPAGSPHRLAGRATVGLERLEWRGSRLVVATGSLSATGVVASRSLVAAAVERLFCGQVSAGVATTSADAPGTPGEGLVAIDSLGCHFTWDAAGLTFAGAHPAIENNYGGELAVSGGQPFLHGPRVSQLSVGHWLQFVSGPAANWLPATRPAVDVAARLPLPE